MYDALVLAGGAARRLGGVDKPALVLAGRSLLDRVLLATAAANRTVVVGPERAVCRPVVWAREYPAGGGPAAALAAGLAHVTADLVVLLAADLPYVTKAAVTDLLGRVGDEDGDGTVITVEGRPQWLCSAWRTAVLIEAVRGRDLAGSSLRGLLEGLRFSRDAAAPQGTWRDCDTPEDLAALVAGSERRTT